MQKHLINLQEWNSYRVSGIASCKSLLLLMRWADHAVRIVVKKYPESRHTRRDRQHTLALSPDISGKTENVQAPPNAMREGGAGLQGIR